MDETSNLKLPYILAAQSQKHITHNEALRALDAIVQLSVADKDLSAPPGSPAEGVRYIVGSSPTGAWAGRGTEIAAYQDAAWAFYAPLEGWLAWVADEDTLYVFNGVTWLPAPGGGGGGSVNPVSLVGVNATADSTNRLSVSSPASLFNHDGAGHQLKINKDAASDTASVLFQTGFSGRAEFGLAGDDDFHVKVSPDGSAWHEALVIAGANGGVRTKSGQVDIASAATCNIGAAAAQRVRITGTTTITSLGTVPNELRFVIFAGALTLTHHSTSLVLPGAASVATIAGDAAVFASDASGNWRCLAYQRANSPPLPDTGGRIPRSVMGMSYYPVGNIADDAVGVVSTGSLFGAIVLVQSNTTSGPQGLFFARNAPTSPQSVNLSATNTPGFYNVALAGTTGTDGRVNFSAFDGDIYIENRSGSTKSFNLWVFGG
ncbi:MAG TPA: DUF2793 domain-containing protein [Hyphomicrobium sp.]|nr:DUF2793 domain-containing protein [Hyphomicrobium sp.]